MAYAGICAGQNQEMQTTPAFHAASLYEIITYVTSDAVKSVPVQTPTNNRPPFVTLPTATFLIPKKTPFVLTAAGGDPDQDKVSYSWEELDVGKEAPPDDDITDTRPIFRSLSPSTNPARTFPTLTNLLQGKTGLGDVLPTRNRVMNFRVTVRDHRAGGGAFHYGTLQVSVISDSGPFVVKQPGAEATWVANSTQTIEWDPAGTSVAPVNCRNVRISLSTDGGATFNVLVESAPNVGSATVTVPNVSTENARIKVEALDNIFFDISDADFKITPAGQ
jgi:hypothetical protein